MRIDVARLCRKVADARPGDVGLVDTVRRFSARECGQDAHLVSDAVLLRVLSGAVQSPS